MHQVFGIGMHVVVVDVITFIHIILRYAPCIRALVKHVLLLFSSLQNRAGHDHMIMIVGTLRAGVIGPASASASASVARPPRSRSNLLSPTPVPGGLYTWPPVARYARAAAGRGVFVLSNTADTKV